MSKNETRLFGFLCFLVAAIPCGLIFFAPVMSQPANGTISATDYFGDK